MTPRHVRHLLASAVVALLGTACSTQDLPTGPTRLAAPGATVRLSQAMGGGEVSRLECPTAQTHSVSGEIGPAGGMLSVYGFRVDFPAGAVVAPRIFTLRVLAGQYLEIDASADGAAHYVFAVPVTVTLELARCGPIPATIGAWYLEPASGALSENMGGNYQPQTGTLQFTTHHFSGYTVAW
jgi:hypothetical protein